MNLPGPKETYWFPAKTHGWGWGPPSTWQGRVVLGLFAVLTMVGAVMILPGSGALPYLGYCVLLCAALIGICWAKGEPPRWR